MIKIGKPNKPFINKHRKDINEIYQKFCDCSIYDFFTAPYIAYIDDGYDSNLYSIGIFKYDPETSLNRIKTTMENPNFERWII